MNSVRRSGIRWGETVVIYGLGLLGQLTARICHLAGARPIVGVDVAESRLRCLPDNPAVIRLNSKLMDVSTVIEDETRKRKTDVVFEATGNPDLIPQEFRVLRNQGRFVVLSSPIGKTSFDFNDLCSAPSYTIIGTHNWSHPTSATLDNPWTYLRDAELFFDLVADRVLELDPLISHRGHYRDACDFYKMLVADRSSAMGVVLDWTG